MHRQRFTLRKEKKEIRKKSPEISGANSDPDIYILYRCIYTSSLSNIISCSLQDMFSWWKENFGWDKNRFWRLQEDFWRVKGRKEWEHEEA